MNRLLTAIILLLVAGSALAAGDNSTGVQLSNFASTLTPPPTDYSVAYLSQVFGTLGDQLTGTSGQIVGHLFDIFNKGVMVVAAIWLGYSTVTLTLGAAAEGSFMRQNSKVHFVLLRIALGFMLIIPSATTGYSVLQNIFMKIVIDGVGLADQTWNSALEYLKYGGQLYIPPATLTNDTSFVSKNISGTVTPSMPVDGQPVRLAAVTQLFQDEVCMYMSSKWPVAYGGATYVQMYSPVFDQSNDLVTFPGIPSGSPLTPVTAGCGSSLDYFGQVHGAISQIKSPSGVQQQEAQMAFLALKQLVNSMLPAAKAYVDEETAVPAPTFAQQETYDSTNAQVVFSAMLAYGNLMTPYQNLVTTEQLIHTKSEQDAIAGNANKTNGCDVALGSAAPIACTAKEFENGEVKGQLEAANGTQFIKVAKSEGWIMAGSFYWKVEQANQSGSGFSLSLMFPTPQPPSADAFNYDSNSDFGPSMVNAARKVVNTYAMTVSNLWIKYVGAQQETAVHIGDSTQSAVGSLLTTVSVMAMNRLASANLDFTSTSTNYNPISVLMNMGNKLILAVAHLWEAALALTVGLAVAAGICDSTSPGGLMLKASMSWVKSIMVMLGGVLLAPGAILAYYVPMYPFIVYTFAAVGWLIMVIEGMAAAPLVCMGLTHPEGHDFLGKAEQALMLFLGIFLRPALMVIGLITAMIVSFVAFHMLIAAFGQIYISLTGGNLGPGHAEVNSAAVIYGGGDTDALANFITDVVTLVIFGMITMELVEQCYKLIYQLPNNIMTWIGGQRQGEEYGQMASKVQSGVSTASGSMKEGASSANSANDSFTTGISKARKLKDENDKKDNGKIQGE